MGHDTSYLVDLIADIRQMSELLTFSNSNLRRRVAELEKEKIAWGEEKEQLTQRLQIVQEEYDILKLAKAIKGDSKNTDEAKAEISRLMREIDQCVALIENLHE